MKRIYFVTAFLFLMAAGCFTAFGKDGLRLNYKDGSSQLIQASSVESIDFIDDLDVQMWEELGTGRYFDYFFGVGPDGDEVNYGPAIVTFYKNRINPNRFLISNPYIGWNGEDTYLEIQELNYGQEYFGQVLNMSYIVGYDPFPVKYDSEYDADIFMIFPGSFVDYNDPSYWVYNQVYSSQDWDLPGKVYLSPIYFIYENNVGWPQWNQTPIEILFPGFLDTEIWMQFQDIVPEESTCKVNVKINMGYDVSNVRVAIGDDNVLDKLRAGEISYVETDKDATLSIDFSYANYNGTYRIAAIGYADGKEVSNDYTTFHFDMSTDESMEYRIQDLLKAYNTNNILGRSLAYDWGYGSIMHIRDVMTEQFPVVYNSYDWYSAWEQDKNLGEGFVYAQFVWNYFTYLIGTVNDFIGECDEENISPQNTPYLGMAFAFRASDYLDMARMYEFLPNKKISPINEFGNDVSNLTVPIVTEKTTEEEAANNPRATRQEMFDFILSDLQKAENLLQNVTPDSKDFPDLAVVYGLYSRLYMWVENYAEAAKYAEKAIDIYSGVPTTREQWLDTTTGFNDLNTPSWMWGISQSKYSQTVESGILNWTSWISNEATFGYAYAGPRPMINAATYERIDNNDFRKLSFIAPYDSPLRGLEPMIDPDLKIYLPYYAALKFRPAQGNISDYRIGGASDYPLMRIEEMYFNWAESLVRSGEIALGRYEFENFMRTYRYDSYTCEVFEAEDVLEEIYFQKAVEFWGEGLTFFDLKRTGFSVIRNYPGTNFYDSCAFNTDGRPAWVNFCIVVTALRENKALTEWNNPDPSDLYSYYY